MNKNAQIDLAGTRFGQTALWEAANQGHSKVVEYLLKKGAHKDHKDKKQRTPVFIASSRGHLVRKALC